MDGIIMMCGARKWRENSNDGKQTKSNGSTSQSQSGIEPPLP